MPLGYGSAAIIGIVSFVLFLAGIATVVYVEDSSGAAWVKESISNVVFAALGIWLSASFLYAADRIFSKVHGTLPTLYWLGFYFSAWLVIGAGVLLWQLRKRQLGVWRSQTMAGIVSGAICTISVLTMFWTLITVLLIHVHVVDVQRGVSDGLSTTSGVGYYGWHFLKEIPALSIPETLGWKEPKLYEGLGIRLLVLGYKLAVIIPTVAAFRLWWQMRKKKAEAATGAAGPDALDAGIVDPPALPPTIPPTIPTTITDKDDAPPRTQDQVLTAHDPP